MKNDSPTSTPTPEPQGDAVELVSNRWLAGFALHDLRENVLDHVRDRWTRYEHMRINGHIAEVSFDTDTKRWRWKLATSWGGAAIGDADTVETARASAEAAVPVADKEGREIAELIEKHKANVPDQRTR